MKIATFNANSIRSRMPMLLEWLGTHQPDVVGIQETKAQDADFPSAEIEAAGYHVVFRGEKSYNGVAILSREPAQEVRFGFDDGGPADETRLVAARIGPVVVVNTYVPQGRAIDHVMYQYKLKWYRRLKALFEKEYAGEPNLIWLGDLNIAVEPIDVTNPKTKKNHVCYHEDCRTAFLEVKGDLVDVFRAKNPAGGEYSFYDYRVKDAVDRGIGWRIDYILARPGLAAACTNAYVDLEPRRKEKPSDHTFLVAEFNL